MFKSGLVLRDGSFEATRGLISRELLRNPLRVRQVMLQMSRSPETT